MSFDQVYIEASDARLPLIVDCPLNSCRSRSYSCLVAVEARTVAAAQILGPPKPDPGVLEAKKEFFKHMDDHLLDYKVRLGLTYPSLLTWQRSPFGWGGRTVP